MDEYLVPNRSFLRLLEEYNKYGSLAIGFDFDNTVFDYHKKGSTYIMVIDLLRELQLMGCKLICWTAQKDIPFVEKYLEDNKIPYNGINIDGIKLDWETRKPIQSALLDDRAGFLQVYQELKLLVEVVNKNNKQPYTT